MVSGGALHSLGTETETSEQTTEHYFCFLKLNQTHYGIIKSNLKTKTL